MYYLFKYLNKEHFVLLWGFIILNIYISLYQKIKKNMYYIYNWKKKIVHIIIFLLSSIFIYILLY